MTKREIELDLLRLMAMLGVIFTHACGIQSGSSANQILLVFMTATVTWHVPVFVMISGRFFMDPQRDVSAAKLKKAIGHLLIAFVFWNIIYQSDYILSGTYTGLNWKGILWQILIGPYHFWYLFMLICMYAVTPFLRRITEDRKLMEYFLVLFLVFEFLTLYGQDLPVVGSLIRQILTASNFHLALGYAGYYILGYYLYRYPLSGKKEAALYLLGIAMFLFTGLATVWNVQHGVEGKEWFSKYLMPNVVIEAAAVYTFFVSRVGKIHFREKTASIISGLAACSFGGYLVHALILDWLGRLGWGSVSTNPTVVVLTATFLGFVISLAAAFLIRLIPGIGKKIT